MPQEISIRAKVKTSGCGKQVCMNVVICMYVVIYIFILFLQACIFILNRKRFPANFGVVFAFVLILSISDNLLTIFNFIIYHIFPHLQYCVLLNETILY